MGSITDELLNGPAMPSAPPAARSATDELLSPPSVPAPGMRAPGELPPKYDPQRAMNIGPQAVASLANDPQARIRYYAQQAGIPEDRFSVVDGAIAYQGDDGRRYLAEPPSRFPRSFSEAGQQLAQGAGPAIPATAGAAAGILSAPMLLAGPLGMAGSMGIAGAGSAAGQAAREGIASAVMGQEMSPRRIALEGAQGALGQGIGAGLTAWANRGAAKDLARLNPQDVASLRAKAQAEGIDLTPAESTGLPSLAARQKSYGNFPASQDTMGRFYEKRAGQVGEAVNRNLAAISPQDSAEIAGKRGVEAAQKAIGDARASRIAASRPLYEKVMTPENVLPAERFKTLADDAFLSEQIDAVHGNKLFGMQSLPKNSLPVLDMVKRNLDDLIETAKRGGEANKVRLLTQRRDALVGTLDDAFPEYPAARAAYAGESPAVDALEKGVVGIVAKLKDPQAKAAAERLFSPTSSGPEAVKVARLAIEKADPEAWQGLKRAYLENLWTKAQTPTLQGEAVNAGPKFRKLMMGDLKQQAILKQMLSPEEFKAFSDLADVLQAAGRVKPIGSDTAWNQEMMKQARREATPSWAKAMRGAQFWKWPDLVADWATERALQKNAGKMAEIITNPDAMNRLKEIRQLSPTSVKFRAAVGQFLVQFGGYGAELVQGELNEQDQ